MSSLVVRFVPGYRILISSDSNEIFYVLKHQLTTIGFTTYRRGRELVQKEYKAALYRMISDNELEIHAGLIDYLASFLGGLKKSDSSVEIKFDFPKLNPIPLLDKWHERFKNHPRGYGDYQIADFATLTRSFSGVGELFTGYGKTELLIAIGESFCEAESEGNVVVTAPNNGVRDELQARFKKYGVDVGIEEWDKRINIINPAGIIRSHRYNDEAKAWLADARMALHDECHHLSNKSNQTFFDSLVNLVRSYGFSASTDSQEGSIPLPGKTDVKDLGETRAGIVALTGGIRIRRMPEIPVHLIKVMSTISPPLPEKEQESNDESWISLLDRTVTAPKLADIIKTIKQNYSETNFYVPVHKCESGLVLYENLRRLGVKAVYWDAGTLLPKEYHTEENEVLSLKKRFSEGMVETLISTSVGFEGIDLPALGGVIPLTGTNHRMVVQPAGRSARGEVLRVVLIYDRNNPILLSQSKKRREKIEQVYKIEYTKTFNM